MTATNQPKNQPNLQSNAQPKSKQSNRSQSNATEYSHSKLHFWQQPKFTIAVALITLSVILVIMNMTINKYETHLQTGHVVLLKLAPVDPRGFMQGDYMALRYAIAEDIREALLKQLPAKDNNDSHRLDSQEGLAIVTLDANNVGSFVRVVDVDTFERDALAPNEQPLYFRIRNRQVKLATNAFFFQEGFASDFERAEYGLFRVNEKGEPLLADMVDENFLVIEGGTVED